MSFAAIRSALCSVAFETVTPRSPPARALHTDERAGTAHIDPDLEQLRELHFRRELARHGQRGSRLPIVPQLGVERALVDFDGDTIGAVVERRQEGLELGDRFVGCVEIVDPRVVRFDRQSHSSSFSSSSCASRCRASGGGFDLESEDAQTAGPRLFGIELAQRAGRGVCADWRTAGRPLSLRCLFVSANWLFGK